MIKIDKKSEQKTHCLLQLYILFVKAALILN